MVTSLNSPRPGWHTKHWKSAPNTHTMISGQLLYHLKCTYFRIIKKFKLTMKKFIFAISILTIVSIIPAQANLIDTNPTTNKALEEKIPVAKEDLPTPILEVLKGDEYPGWKFVKAYKLEPQEEEKVFYEVVLTKNDIEVTIIFDKEGEAQPEKK